MEAAPTTANDAVMEAAPTTVMATTNPSQANIGSVCQWEARFTAGRVCSSSESFEFDLESCMCVQVTSNCSHWNMSDWVALLMGNELGLSFSEMLELHETLVNGTNGEDDFTPNAVRIETN